MAEIFPNLLENNQLSDLIISMNSKLDKYKDTYTCAHHSQTADFLSETIMDAVIQYSGIFKVMKEKTKQNPTSRENILQKRG